MSERRLREALLDARIPDAPGAEERAHRLVRAAYAASRRRSSRADGWGPAAACRSALAVGLLAVADQPRRGRGQRLGRRCGRPGIRARQPGSHLAARARQPARRLGEGAVDRP